MLYDYSECVDLIIQMRKMVFSLSSRVLDISLYPSDEATVKEAADLLSKTKDFDYL